VNRFDETTHRYYQGDLVVPGVTTVLKHGGLIDMRWFTDEARVRGTLVHELTHAVDAQLDLDTDTLAFRGGVLGELDAYHRFLDDYRPVYRLIERAMFHPTLRYGGKPDRVCSVFLGRPAVLEIKTGQPSSWHGVQLAGYQLLEPTGARWVVYLKPNGRYQLAPAKRAEDYADFYRALREYWRVAA
jgi:hypothetical protein